MIRKTLIDSLGRQRALRSLPIVLALLATAAVRLPPQQQPPPQQPPLLGGGAVVPPTATVDSSLTVSSWPDGQGAGSDDSAIGREISNVDPQARQR